MNAIDDSARPTNCVFEAVDSERTCAVSREPVGRQGGEQPGSSFFPDFLGSARHRLSFIDPTCLAEKRGVVIQDLSDLGMVSG